MNSLVPSNSGDALAEQRLNLVTETVKKLPLLLLVQLIANPILAVCFLLALPSTYLTNPGFNGVATSYLTEALLVPIYWAFLVGGANRINLALARNEPAKLSMLFSRRTLIRKYLGATMVFFLWANVTVGVATIIPALLAILSSSTIVSYVSIVSAAVMVLVSFAQIGFIDLAIVDKNLDSFQALNESMDVAKGNTGVLFCFYLGAVLSLIALIAVSRTLVDAAMPACLLTIIWLTVLNFYRVKLYCAIQKRKVAALSAGQSNQILPAVE